VALPNGAPYRSFRENPERLGSFFAAMPSNKKSTQPVTHYHRISKTAYLKSPLTPPELFYGAAGILSK